MKQLALYWTMMTMAPVSFVVCAVLLAPAFQPGPESQAFLDCDTDLPRYDDGSDLICRPNGTLVAAVATPGNESPGGWGRVLGTCEADCECYCDGEFQCRHGGCVVYVYPFDADGDGRLTLRDYAAFQRVFTGP